MALAQICPLCKRTIKLDRRGTFYRHENESQKCSGSRRTPEQATKIYNDRLQRRDLWDGFC